MAACFLGQINVGTEIMNYLVSNNSKPDVLSPAAYFGLLSPDYTVLNTLGAGATVDTVISLMQNRYDLLGREFHVTNFTDERMMKVETKGIPAGVYVMKIISEAKLVGVKKIILDSLDEK